MSGKLTGKVAIITGASAGIGRASALALAAEGAHVVITARRGERLEELTAEIKKLGSNTTIVVGDARDEKTAEEIALTFLTTEFEGGRHERRVEKIHTLTGC